MRGYPERYIDLSQSHNASREKYTKSSELNVINEFKSLSQEVIRQKVKERQLPYAILMTHIERDYNLGNILRIGNALGAKVYYYGAKKWDRRSSIGCQNYSPLHYLSSIDELRELKKTYARFVALEQTKNSVLINDYQWIPNSLFIIGEEGRGLQSTPEVFELADDVIEIEQRGSIRSLNASAACAIAAYDFASKFRKK